jgi:hypothetical protein
VKESERGREKKVKGILISSEILFSDFIVNAMRRKRENKMKDLRES